MKSNGQWHGLITNADSQSDLIHLEFGTDLTTIDNAVSLGNFGALQFGYGLSHLTIGNSIRVYVTNRSSKEIVELTFSNDLSVFQGQRTFVIPARGFLRGNAFMRYENGLVGTTVSEQGELFLLIFESESSFPQIVEIRPLGGVPGQPMNVNMFVDKGQLLSMITTREGLVHRVNYGETVSFDPEITNLPNLSQSPVIYFGASWINYDSKWRVFITDARVNRVVSFEFEAPCDASLTSSSDQDPGALFYLSPGVKHISLTARNDLGEEDYLSDTVIVNRGPFPEFSLTGTCSGSPTLFINETVFDSQISTVSWDFGDGNTSSELNPEHVYASGGDYDISLTMTDDCGVSRNNTRSVRIYDQGEIIPDFSVPALLCSNSPLTFQDQSEYGTDGPAGYAWTVDGTTVGSSEELLYTFDTPGTYSVNLEVTGISGCNSSITKSITVIEGPDPSFTVDDACQGSLMEFTNTSSGQVSSYLWDFGNGVTSSLENPAIEYDSDGQYLVSLTLTNAAGCVSQFTQSVTVYANPEIRFENDLACEGSETFFRDASFATNSNIVAWEWDFGDPDSGDNTSTEREPSHIFSSAGLFDVTLTATTNFGCQATAVQQVTVLESPTAEFSYGQACIGEPIQFQDNSFPPSGESLTSWAWDLGGTFSGQRNPSITFDFARTYDITLSVTASNQCVGTETRQITILDPPEVLMGIEQPCAGTPVRFIDLTVSEPDPVVSRSWDFAGLGLSADSVAQFTFPGSGNYAVSLTVTLASGCSFTAVQNVSIDQAPVASFEIDKTFGPPPLTIQASSTSQNAQSVLWLVEEEIVGSDPALTYTFSDFGTYELALVAGTAGGCLDTVRQVIQVTEPDVDISVSDLSITPPVSGSGPVMLLFTARNSGSIALNRLPVHVVLEADFEIIQEIEADLPPDNSPVQIELPVRIGQRSPLNICVRIPDTIEGVPDSDPSNNSTCSSDQLVLAYPPYPNPASERVNFDILSTGDYPVRVEVFSSSGSQKFSGTIATERSGIQTLTLETSSWAGGTYILQVTTPEDISVYRFVIQR